MQWVYTSLSKEDLRSTKSEACKMLRSSKSVVSLYSPLAYGGMGMSDSVHGSYLACCGGLCYLHAILKY